MYLVLITLVTISLFYILKLKRSRVRRMVFKFPACTNELPILGSCLDVLGSPEVTMKTLLRYSDSTSKLGGAARFYMFNLCYIVLTDALDLTEALKIHLDKGHVYKFFQEVTGNGSIFAPAEVAKVRRQIMTPIFSPRILYSYFDTFCEESIKLTEVMAQHAGAGPFSVENYLNVWSFDTVLKTMGVKESDEVFYTRDFYHALNRGGKLAHERISSFWLYPSFFHKFSRNYAEIQEYSKIGYRNASEILEKRRYFLKNNEKFQSNTGSNQDQVKVSILDFLLKSNLSDLEIREEILMLLGATSTTSVSVGFTLMLLAQYPSVQDKVHQELQNVLDNSDRPLMKEDLAHLDYLDMVIKESLRLYPPAPLIFRKAHTDLTLPSGRIIPAGAEIAALLIGLHRNKNYWGADADHFDPDRFSSERYQNLHPNAFQPFSSGARNCIGYKYGQISLKVCLATILRKYKIVGKPALGPIPNIRLTIEMVLKDITNFEIQIVNRNANST